MTAPDLAVLDYGMGNLHSVRRAWEHVGARVRVVERTADLGEPDALIFPGQGRIVECMRRLHATGFASLIGDWIASGRPFFGICLGLQALFEHSEEGDTPCLGVLPGHIRRFTFAPESRLKVPHMGWNDVALGDGDGPLARGLSHVTPRQFYFVHSYYAEAVGAAHEWGLTDYGGQRFTSAVRFGACVATQFHPEKSQAAGLALYRGFIETLLVEESPAKA